MKPGTLSWYWHRLRAMDPGEMWGHARKKVRQRADAARKAWPEVDFSSDESFPRLPNPSHAPEVLREALRRDVEAILAGRWRFFGYRELTVDLPPKWQCDYLVRRDMATDESAFALNYRALPGGTDSKVIWEPSRWHQLVRLAMAAYVLGDLRAAQKCVEWLEDWVEHNPAYCGWNWTSALEVGLRLIQFAWIDAFLGGRCEAARLERLRRSILPAHVWYSWRHQSFGSSANNHLLGELAGLIVATVRWPGLERCGAKLEELAWRWECEVLKQFAEDGGNKEQALSYQLFSWECCWQAGKALDTSGRVTGYVEQRLAYASRFFCELQARNDPWDYGDSDNAIVVPLFCHWDRAVAEWHKWFEAPRQSPALHYWLGEPPGSLPPVKSGPPIAAKERGPWWYYPESGMAIAECGFWWLRWDLSPLGYLGTAAHGHLDALHVSIWRKGVALVIDPGTGAYHADKPLRTWLASREAHNGPCPARGGFPRRIGPFLWREHHATPQFELKGGLPLASLLFPFGTIRRSVRLLPDSENWEVADSIDGARPGDDGFTVRWQFAPGCWVKQRSAREFTIHRGEVAMSIQLGETWDAIELVEVTKTDPPSSPAGAEGASLEGVVSPAFRQTTWAPYLKLTARPRGDHPCVFTTTFLASAHS